jgi:secernin
MGCDTVVALGRATKDGCTILGQNSNRPRRLCQSLCLTPHQVFAAGQVVRTQYLELPQAREVYAVLGSQPGGFWGYDFGINEYQLAAGCVGVRAALPLERPGLTGTDLVRLTLERCRSARQAVDLLTALIDRHGQGAFHDCPASEDRDHVFLLTDPHEAYAVETAGHHWVYQEVQEIRAASNVRVVRQDWDRISHGLADLAIDQGWWPGDGSKLDFAGALREEPSEHAAALWRWGRTTRALQELNGRIDTGCVRELLRDRFEAPTIRGEPLPPKSGPRLLAQYAKWWGDIGTTSSFVAPLGPNATRLPMAWYAFGAPALTVYFPIFLDGAVPDSFTCGSLEPISGSFWWRIFRLGERLRRNASDWAQAQESLGRLQARFDEEAEEFIAEGTTLKERGQRDELHRQATFFMEHNVELFEAALAEAQRSRPLVDASW